MTDLSAIKRTRVYDGIIDVFSGHLRLVSQMLNMVHTEFNERKVGYEYKLIFSLYTLHLMLNSNTEHISRSFFIIKRQNIQLVIKIT